MPYIKDEEKNLIDRGLRVFQDQVDSAGKLAYTITRLISEFKDKHSDGNHRFSDFALVSGVMTETLAEYRRRVILPYEKEKRDTNGDVF